MDKYRQVDKRRGHRNRGHSDDGDLVAHVEGAAASLASSLHPANTDTTGFQQHSSAVNSNTVQTQTDKWSVHNTAVGAGSARSSVFTISQRLQQVV